MAPVAIVAPFIYTESIWGMFSLWWRYGYLPTAPELLGAAIILLSCAGILVYVLMAPAAGRPVLARTADSQRAPVE